MTRIQSLATKVQYGSGERFDPMMEEKGGWILGEAPRHDAVVGCSHRNYGSRESM